MFSITLLLALTPHSDLPPAGDAYRFGLCRGQCQAVVTWHQRFRLHLQNDVTMRQEEKQKWLTWSDRVRGAYDDLDSGLCTFNEYYARTSLWNLKAHIGEENYERGQMPDPIPPLRKD